MNLPNNPTYSSGRTVKARNLQYLSRPADEEILAYCRNSQPAFILTSPHMGKSSIIARTAERLKKEKTYHPVIIDLSQFPLPLGKRNGFKKSYSSSKITWTYQRIRSIGSIDIARCRFRND